jgi:hypothetical protein
MKSGFGPGEKARAESFADVIRTIFQKVANSRRPLAVQELRNWTCGTVLPSVAGSSFVVCIDLGFESRPACRSAEAGIIRWRDLFRVSSPSVLLSPILLRPSPPPAVFAFESLSAPLMDISGH